MLRIIDLALEKKGISAAAASRLAVGNTAMIKNIRLGQKPSFVAVEKLLSVLDIKFQYGFEPQLTADSRLHKSNQLGSFSTTLELFNHGLAKCGIVGWFNARADGKLPAPDGLTDPDAFYVRGFGNSMTPEGIPTGAYCLVSPSHKPTAGDRVYITDLNGLVSIKRLVKEDYNSYYLRGWQAPEHGKQQSYDDQRFKSGLKDIWPVVAVYKRKPVAGKKIEYIIDPRLDEFSSFAWQISESADTVRLYGYAGEGGAIVYGSELPHSEVVPAPPGENKHLAAIEIRGDNASPFLREGDRIFFYPDFPANPNHHIGRLILATVADGTAFIKILRRGDTSGRWNLQSINTRYPLIEDVELKHISPLVWVHYNGHENPFQKM